MNTLNPSLKLHTFVGLFLSLWVFIFTYYIKPFDGAAFNDDLWWLFLSIGFALIIFMCYFFTAMAQNSFYQRFSIWNVVLEIGTIVLFLVFTFYTTYLYYKSPFLNGINNFTEYFYTYLKSSIIFLPVLVFTRIYTVRKLPEQPTIVKVPVATKEKILTFKGNYKLDVLKVKESDLICASKSQNYVELFYIENDALKSKLIRSSLKQIESDFHFLVKVHRSHLINPTHFKSWKNSKTILLTHIEVPVSKNYKGHISLL